MAEKPRDSCVLPMHLRIIYPVSHDSMSIDHETENFFKKSGAPPAVGVVKSSRPCCGAPLLYRRTASCSACLLPLQRRSRTTLLVSHGCSAVGAIDLRKDFVVDSSSELDGDNFCGSRCSIGSVRWSTQWNGMAEWGGGLSGQARQALSRALAP